ncbi:uncharacterized protein LOC124918083 [Impatiens glandulifera]|uniref:uncharacterized protein LOC124918083 n=1 Tax=Impatiens glandulifera TaxID=253017 RepID=UPI001FB0646B|nr:uncharacterized protein LOC124918083 [Impatiens glandulifera]
MVDTQKFDNIKMHHGETINKFEERFTNIINELAILGKVYGNKEIIVKALRALLSAWEVKTTVMRESRNLHKMHLHDLFDDLKNYEFEMNSRNEDDPSSSNVTRELVSSVEPAFPEPIKSAERFRKDAMTLLVKKFGRFMKKNHSNSSYHHKNNLNDYKANIHCFNCDTLGHYKLECQKPRRDDNKAMLEEERKSKWAQSDSYSNNEEIKCFMANDEEVFDFASEEFTRVDLITALNDMVIECKKLYVLASTQLDNTTGKTNELSYENKKLKETVQLLTKEKEKTNYLIVAWTKSRDAVNQMMSHQRPANCKFGLGYDNSNLDKSCKELKPKKGKLPSISFVNGTSTNTQTSHGADESVTKKELKYVEQIDKSRWLSLERMKVSRSTGHEHDGKSKRYHHNSSSKYSDSSKGRQRDVKPYACRIIKTNTRRFIRILQVWILKGLINRGPN